MRLMLKVSMPVEKANALVKKGKLGSVIQSILDYLKPEAAYFAEDKGERTGYIFLDIKDSSEIPRIAEPWFLALDARVELHPAMKPEDLDKAAPAFKETAQRFG